jgi:hypothetical protein
MRSRPTSGGRSFLAVATWRLAPHSWLFLLFNLVYFLPLLGVLLFNYSEGGTTTAADLDPDTAGKIAWIYLLGCSAFLCGSRLDLSGSWTTANTPGRSLRLFGLSWSFWIICSVVVTALMVSKVLLIPAGVYSEYAFDTESMTGGAWSFSMFCSESVLFLSIAVLFSRARRNLLWFLVLTVINGVNLLHGTRIFAMIAGVVFCFYLYVRGKFSLKLAVFAASSLLALGYLVYVTRSNIGMDDETFSAARVISPLMYEGIFSQISLIQTVHNPNLWRGVGSPPNFFLDAIYFLTPRVLLPQKDAMLFTDRFTDLSPLGAFSGYAQGLLYFGVCFPLFYFLLGSVAAWLFRRAKDSSFWSVIYVYFACDFLFRVMRDGYIIPIKMLIDALIILAFVALWSPSPVGFTPPDAGQSMVHPHVRLT